MRATHSPADVKVDRYWDVVRRTLKEVFGIAHAPEVDDLQNDLCSAPADEQALFYHADPLSIAAEIAGEKPTDSQIREYLKIRDFEYARR